MKNVTRPDVFIRKRFKIELVLFHENYYLIIFCQISVGQWVLLENQSFLSGTICHTAAVAEENQRHRPNYLIASNISCWDIGGMNYEMSGIHLIWSITKPNHQPLLMSSFFHSYLELDESRCLLK